MAEMVTIEIPGVPSPNVLGADRWHRNAHNDRTTWRQRVDRAVMRSGQIGKRAIVLVRVDWGTRRRLTSTAATERFADELESALQLAGIETVSRPYPLDEEQSGVGGGTVWVTLEAAAVA